MNDKTYMLPHGYRKYGYGLAAAAFLAFLLGLLLANVLEVIPQTHTRFITMTMFFLLFLGVFVILMTEEKDEDEMTGSIRRRTISLTAMITFVLYVASSLVIAFVEGFRSLRFPEIYRFHSMVSNIMTPLLIYLVIFRISIWKVRSQCKEDTE